MGASLYSNSITMDKEGLKLEIELLEGNSPCPSRQGSASHMPELLLVTPDHQLKVHLSKEISRVYPGSCIRHAADALEAYAILSHQSPDMVISELSLPYLSGYSLLKKLRSQSKPKQTPFIMLSSEPLHDMTDTKQCRFCPPFDSAALQELLTSMLPF